MPLIYPESLVIESYLHNYLKVLCSRSACSTEGVPGQLRLRKETLSQKHNLLVFFCAVVTDLSVLSPKLPVAVQSVTCL